MSRHCARACLIEALVRGSSSPALTGERRTVMRCERTRSPFARLRGRWRGRERGGCFIDGPLMPARTPCSTEATGAEHSTNHMTPAVNPDRCRARRR